MNSKLKQYIEEVSLSLNLANEISLRLENGDISTPQAIDVIKELNSHPEQTVESIINKLGFGKLKMSLHPRFNQNHDES
jgi:arginyl-tRNA synthetase